MMPLSYMRKLILLLMVIVLGVFSVSCSSGKQSNGAETQNGVQVEESTQAEEITQVEETSQVKEAAQPQENTQVENTQQAEEPVDTEKHTFSELFTDDQIREIRRGLKVPDDIEVAVEVGNSYFWDGGNMDLAQVDFYHDGQYCAGAACEVGTSNIVKNIYSY